MVTSAEFCLLSCIYSTVYPVLHQSDIQAGIWVHPPHIAMTSSMSLDCKTKELHYVIISQSDCQTSQVSQLCMALVYTHTLWNSWKIKIVALSSNVIRCFWNMSYRTFNPDIRWACYLYHCVLFLLLLWGSFAVRLLRSYFLKIIFTMVPT